MVGDNKPSEHKSIIDSIKSPLGFFALALLIIEGVLIGTSALTSKIEMWMPLALLGLVVILVFIIVIFKPQSLYPPSRPQTKKTKLEFPNQTTPPTFDVGRCTLTVRDINGHEKPKITPNLKLDYPTGWSFSLPMDLEDGDTVLLELIDRENGKWEAGPFDPFESRVETNRTS